MIRKSILAAFLAVALVASAEERAPGDQGELEAKAYAGSRTHARRVALSSALEGALIVISSGKTNESEARGHRANRDFLYLSGIWDPGCAIVIDRQRDVLFAPPRHKERETWTGEHVYPSEETAERYGFRDARPIEELKAELAELAKDREKVFVAGFSEDAARALLPDGVKVERAEAEIGKLRQVKDEAELALLKRAAEISAVAHIYCSRAIAPERFEYEVQGLFEGCCRFLGAQAQGYPSIVGSGPNSCVLHYDKDRRQMKEGDMLVLDAAGECGGYSADVTRTFPVAGKFSEEQRRVYEAVLEAQDAGIAACRPGATIKQVNDAARAVLRKKGLEKWLPHGVSHWLGLDVHDAGDYSLPLAPGMVLTVEPGVYIAEKELGVRIEDDILVTESGPVNLSGHAPRSADEIEALLAKARSAPAGFPSMPPATPVPSLRKHKGKLY